MEKQSVILSSQTNCCKNMMDYAVIFIGYQPDASAITVINDTIMHRVRIPATMTEERWMCDGTNPMQAVIGRYSMQTMQPVYRRTGYGAGNGLLHGLQITWLSRGCGAGKRGTAP